MGLYTKQTRSLDVEERKKAFWEMERILREEIVPYISFYWVTKSTGHWKEVKGYAGFGVAAGAAGAQLNNTSAKTIDQLVITNALCVSIVSPPAMLRRLPSCPAVPRLTDQIVP